MTPLIQETLLQGLRDGKFTGCAIGVQKMGDKPFFTSIGRTSLMKESVAVDENTLFDLASLTKVLFPTTLTALFLEDETIQLNVALKNHPGLEEIAPLIKGTPYQDCTFEDLLMHRAGFPARADFSEICPTLYTEVRNYDMDIPTQLIRCISQITPEYQRGEKTVYCDPGFIFLAEIFALWKKQSVENLWRNEIQVPWNLHSIKHAKQYSAGDSFAIAAKDLGPGEVQDPEVRYLKKLCGHAGLFGSITDLLTFGGTWLAAYLEGHDCLTQKTAKRFIDPYMNVQSTSRRLGWDGVSENSTAGNISKMSIGHLGYTGTSIWIDLENQIVVSMLTNRTLTQLENSDQSLTSAQIREFNEFRRTIHNEIWRMFVS